MAFSCRTGQRERAFLLSSPVLLRVKAQGWSAHGLLVTSAHSRRLFVPTSATSPQSPERDDELTVLLQRAQEGDTDARDRATHRVYGELHRLAQHYLRDERGEVTLQPTALVHEAYLRLIGQEAPWRNRGHFFGIAAQMMRRILVDHARRRSAARRDRGRVVSIDALSDDQLALSTTTGTDGADEILGVHDALEEMERVDSRQARIVELKFFVGMTLDEIADVMQISPATVSREWSMARAWLRQRLHAS